MLDKIKSEIYINLEGLFTEETIHDMTGDIEAYKTALKKIATVAEVLGISTKITHIEIDLNHN